LILPPVGSQRSGHGTAMQPPPCRIYGHKPMESSKLIELLGILASGQDRINAM
jgi:hypothetical protein